jgi:hypothetical protein
MEISFSVLIIRVISTYMEFLNLFIACVSDIYVNFCFIFIFILTGFGEATSLIEKVP